MAEKTYTWVEYLRKYTGLGELAERFRANPHDLSRNELRQLADIGVDYILDMPIATDRAKRPKSEYFRP